MLENRDWSVPVNETKIDKSKENNEDAHFDVRENKMRFLAEILFIMRPICHCSLIFA